MKGQHACMLVCYVWVFASVFAEQNKHVHNSKRRPNIILFNADDFGYGDLSVYGNPTQEFGPIDQLAHEGIRFTQWYAPAVFCTPSRTALLTGRLAFRSGMFGHTGVLLPRHIVGLPKSETTLAQVLQTSGYKTGIVGKWHLGINEHKSNDGNFLPMHYGFDYVGHILPFTLTWDCDEKNYGRIPPRKCVLMKNDTIVQQPIYLKNLSYTFLEDAKAFIYNNAEKPFFLYYSLPQTHTPMFSDPQFEGKSKRGPYGDQIIEMGHAVGQIKNQLYELGIEKDTLIVFISDHGPHIEMCLAAGNAEPFKGGKGTFWEGGSRVPAIAWWPGVISPGQVSTILTSSMDLFPTLINLAGGNVPEKLLLDGKDISPLLLGISNDEINEKLNTRPIFYYCGDILAAIRIKEFKIHFRRFPLFEGKYVHRQCPEGQPRRDFYMGILCSRLQPLKTPEIYNLLHDPGEKYPLFVEKYQDVLDEAFATIATHNSKIDPRKVKPLLNKENLVPAVAPCCNPPYCACNYPVGNGKLD